MPYPHSDRVALVTCAFSGMLERSNLIKPRDTELVLYIDSPICIWMSLP